MVTDMKHILRSLYHHRFLNIIVIVTIAAGLMFPLTISATVSFMLDSLALCSYKDPQNHIVVNCWSVYQTPAQLDEWLIKDGVVSYGYLAYQGSGILHTQEKGISLEGVAGITQSYLDLEGCRLDAGRFFTEEEYAQGAHVCILRSTSEWKVGDSYSLMGVDYKIVGLINLPKMYGSVLVPYRCMEELSANNKMQFRFAFQMTDSEASSRFPASAFAFSDEILGFDVGDSINTLYIESIQNLITGYLKKSSIVVLAALFSILFVLTGKVCEERYLIGLRMSMGANGARIYLELLIENGILTLCALLLDLLLFPIVIHCATNVYGYPSAWMLGCITGALILIVAAVSGMVYLQTTKHATPAELLKKEG